MTLAINNSEQEEDETFGGGLSWLEYYLVDKKNGDKRTLRINDNPKWAIRLKRNKYYTQEQLEGLVREYCNNNEGLDYVGLDTVRNCVKEKIWQINNEQKYYGGHDDEEEEVEDEEKKKTAKAKKALELAIANSQKLFLNEFGRAFAAMNVDGHIEVHPMDEQRFKNWISGIYYERNNDLLSEEDLKKIVRILTAKAEFPSSGVSRHRLDVRVRGYNKKQEEQFQNDDSEDSEDGGGVGSVGYVGSNGEITEDFDAIYYDLTNKRWEAVKITPEG